MLNDLKIILPYEIKIKIRGIKSLVKNLFTGLILISAVFIFMAFQFGKMIILNQDLINLYSNQIFLVTSIVIIIFTLVHKKPPLNWHPASMIHLSSSKFSTIFKLSLFKKIIPQIILSIFIALILNNFKMNFKAILLFLSFWNLLIISLISRYFIYNKGLNTKIVNFLLMYIGVLNFQLYINEYLSIILILSLTYASILSIRKAVNIDCDFDKSFTEMVFINRANYLARSNVIEDTQKFVREVEAEKSKKKIILKNIKFKNPLIQKNIITFSRINLFVSFYLFAIFLAVIILYRFEPFKFVKTIKELGLGIPIVAFNQTMFISNIIILIREQKNLLVRKSKEGLYLPYGKGEIIKSFIVLGVPVLLIATLIVGILLQKPLWIIATSLFLYSLILFISLSIGKKKKLDFFEMLINLGIFGVSYLLVGLV